MEPTQVSFFDVPLHYNFHNASKAGSKYDLRTIFNNTVAQVRPGDAVTFVTIMSMSSYYFVRY